MSPSRCATRDTSSLRALPTASSRRLRGNSRRRRRCKGAEQFSEQRIKRKGRKVRRKGKASLRSLRLPPSRPLRLNLPFFEYRPLKTMPLLTHYRSRLAHIHSRKRPRTYLEIGVWSGRSLSLAGPDTLTIGVDPDPQITEKLPQRVKIFCETSDQFFATRDVSREFDGLPIDLVFIDGFHHFEYALRDFINTSKCCAPGSLIVIHDVLPHDARMAQRTRETEAWTGDVWKVIPAL